MLLILLCDINVGGKMENLLVVKRASLATMVKARMHFFFVVDRIAILAKAGNFGTILLNFLYPANPFFLLFVFLHPTLLSTKRGFFFSCDTISLLHFMTLT